ncbi:MAG: aminotransferase class IV family protein [Bacteroidales bacterium]|nr:aminotransferase class IV family protein [Bacteroidales bacterium]
MKRKESKNIISNRKVGNLIETIRVQNKTFQNIEYHNARFNASRRKLFSINDELNLENEITIPENLSKKIYKCRITYSSKIEKAEFEKYTSRVVNSLKLLECNDIDYSFKYADRSKINELFAQHGDCDDILIIKNGLVTDTSFANIVFWDGTKWITPDRPLLAGTARARLLDSNKIFKAEIKLDDLRRFKKVRIFNAMNDLEGSDDILLKV